MIICPICGHLMEQQLYRVTWDCDHCSFQVSELDAQRLDARNAQEAADLKYMKCIEDGWSPFKTGD